MNIVAIGPPGSGKSTQARLLAEALFIPYVEGSQILGAVAKTEDGLGKLVKEKMEKGELVDDYLTLMAVESHLQNPWFAKGFVLDGFPRNLWQAKNFKKNPDKVFYIEVSDEVNLERLTKRGRKDDIPSLVKKRLRVYHQQTELILKFYQKKGVLEKVDGERKVEEIQRDIMERLDK